MTNSMTKRNVLKNRLLKNTVHFTTIHFSSEILWMYFAGFKLHFNCAVGLRKGSYELVGSIIGISKHAFYFLYKQTGNNYLSRDDIFPHNETA